MHMSKIHVCFFVMLLLAQAGVHVSAQENGSPSPRMGPRLVYDEVNGRVLLFGGAIWTDRYTFYNDLRSFDRVSGAWTEVEVPGLKPSGRFNTPLVYVPDRGQILVFGGFSSVGRVGDTWAYDVAENTWTRLQPVTQPSPRSDAAIAYDDENHVVVMFGGYGNDDETTSDTWVFDFNQMNWVEMHPEGSPRNQYGGQMVYDTENKALLMYPGHWSVESGGALVSHGYGDNIWVYSYAKNSWTETAASSKPPGRYWFNLAYAAQSGEIVLFGGSGGGDAQLDDTWLYDYDANTWTRLNSDVKPPVRACSSMAYDPSSNSVVMFGGSYLGHATYSDTWVLDLEGGAWSEAIGVESEAPVEDSGGIPGFPLLASLCGLLVALAMLCKPLKLAKG